MFVILEVSKQSISFIFPTSIYFIIWPFILELSTNSRSEPHVSEHLDPSIGGKVTVGDSVGDDKRVTVDGDDVATMGDDVVEIIVGGKEKMGAI